MKFLKWYITFFFSDAKTNCNQFYAGEMTADEEFELKSRSKRGADLKSNLAVKSQTNAKDAKFVAELKAELVKIKKAYTAA